MGTYRCPRLLLAASLFALSAVAAAQNAVTTDSADIYAGPDDSYPIVAQVDPDTPVEVNGCLNDWSWCDVSFEDNRGWVYAPDIIYGYQGGYVPLYTYAPSLGIPIVEFSIGPYWDHYYHDRPWYSRRDEWFHRVPSHHRRPPGPPPIAGPPPRTAFVEPPHRGGPDGSFRLGRAEPGHAPPREGPRPRDDRAGPAERVEPPRANERGEPPRPEGRFEPMERDRREAPPPTDHVDHVAPSPRATEHVQPTHPAEPPRVDEHRGGGPGTAQHEEHPQPRPEAQHHEERGVEPGGPRRDMRPHQERPDGESPH